MDPAQVPPVGELMKQYRRLYNDRSPTQTTFKISPQQLEEIDARLLQEPDVRGHVYDKVWFNYSWRTEHLAIRSRLYQEANVIRWAEEMINAYLESAKTSSIGRASELAPQVKVRGPQFWRVQEPSDPDYVPKRKDSIMPLEDTYLYSSQPSPGAGGSQRPSGKARMATDTSASCGSPDSTSVTGPKDIRRLTHYQPDLSIFTEPREIGHPTGHPTIAIEVGRTQRIFDIREKMMSGFHLFGFRTLLGIDIDSQAGRFEGHDLEPGAVYVYLWRTWRNENGELVIKTEVFQKVLGPRPSEEGAQRKLLTEVFESLCFGEFLHRGMFSTDDRRPELEKMMPLGQVKFSIKELRKAIARGEAQENAPVPEPEEVRKELLESAGFLEHLAENAKRFPDEVTEE